MVYKITIENFFSIADRQELSFAVADNAPELDCFSYSRSDKKARLPNIIGIFGPNASGKSTVLRAIVSVGMFIIHSFDWKKDGINLFFQAYRQKNWWGKPTKIIIEFDSQIAADQPSSLFRYELHIAHQENHISNKIVTYEELSYAPNGRLRCLFKRENEKFDFSKEFSISNKDDPRVASIRPDASVISTLIKFNHPIAIFLGQLVNGLQTNIVGSEKIKLTEDQILSFYAGDNNCFADLNREIRRLDVGIEAMAIEKGPQGLFARFQHVGLDGKIFYIEESSGTQRFIEIFPKLYYALQTGGVVVIDELDADIHPLLFPELFRWFNDPERNPYKAQLIFTAHNPAILDELEKEQVFFTTKQSGYSTYVYGAKDIKGLRREPSLMKKYLSGELGAIPNIG